MITPNPHLTDLQLVLLSTADRRDDGSLLPSPDRLTHPRATLTRAINALIRRKLVVEVELDASSGSPATDGRLWRQNSGQWLGVIITDAGRVAIAAAELPQADGACRAETIAAADQLAEDAGTDDHAASPTTLDSEPVPPSPTEPQNKSALVLALLRREDGATLADLTAATGWLPHTTRAALTGLRKKGHAIGREKHGNVSIYSIAGRS